MRKLMCLLIVLVQINFVEGILAQSSGSFGELIDVNKQSIEKFLQHKNAFEDVKLNDHYYVLIDFNRLPNKALSQQLEANNISLLSYQWNNQYLASIPSNLTEQKIADLGIISITKTPLEKKISQDIKFRNYPEWANASNGMLDVAIVFVNGLQTDKRDALLAKYEMNVLASDQKEGTIVIARMSENTIVKLIKSPLVSYIDIKQEPVNKLNHENRNHQKVNVLQASNGIGKNLRGTGVCVGVGDGGELGDHLDFSGRVYNEADGHYTSFGQHGDHVAGIVGAAGIIDPRHRGMAPDCDLVIQKTSLITSGTASYFEDYEMVITNNSYGTSFNCESNGSYNYTSQNLDWQMRSFPKVLHVFASGNSGGSTCAPYPRGYKTVLRYYQSAKNVLTVGNVDENREIYLTSSKGPVLDGRIKPEICGIGMNVYSTGRTYNYWKGAGTSMAAPSVAGTLALINQRYRQLNGDEMPDGGLIKAIACNTADDIANDGPDYATGFGLINGRRAVDVLDEETYTSSEISNNEQNTHSINIPAGTKKVKALLYWVDKEAEPNADKALVNDLDIQLVDPNGNVYLPWVLNPAAANVEDLATRAVDTLNNIEQISIDNPQPGTYTVLINGSAIPVGPQTYYLTWENISDEVVLTYPLGGESLTPNKTELIQWDTDDTNTSTFDVQYSSNGDGSWMSIASDLPADTRHLEWDVPNEFTQSGKIRVTKNTGGVYGENLIPFNIMKEASDVSLTSLCDGFIEINWTGVNYADQYDILMFNGEDMEVIATVDEEGQILENPLTIGEEYWFSIRAISLAGNYSQRTIAKSITVEHGSNCIASTDIAITSIQANLIGRKLTNSSLTDSEPISITIKNVGTDNVSNIPVYYSINGAAAITEVVDQVIVSGDSLVYTFSQKADFSQAALYDIDAWVDLAGDSFANNNSLIGTTQAKNLKNDPVVLPYIEAFSSATDQMYIEDFMGIDGVEAWDFQTIGGGYVEVETISGGDKTKKLGVMEEVSPTATINNESLLTLNLANHDVTRGLLLDFDFIGKEDQTGNGVWVRGSENEDWLLLNSFRSSAEWATISNLDVMDLLLTAGQSLSTSFQIKFEQSQSNGFMIDNIHLSAGVLLPVELTYFTAEKFRDDVWLKWETSSEQNNDYFEIELAKNQTDIADGKFEIITKIAGHGTTTEPQIYQFFDREPAKAGTRYYRLKQVDYDGTITYSEIKAVDFKPFPEPISLYPNPFYNRLTLHYTSEVATSVNCTITDMKGRLVQQLFIPIEQGEQDINLEIDEQLAIGFYIVQLKSDSQMHTFKVAKQH